MAFSLTWLAFTQIYESIYGEIVWEHHYSIYISFGVILLAFYSECSYLMGSLIAFRYSLPLVFYFSKILR